MPHSFGRAIDDAITEFQQQLAAERERLLAEMQRDIIDPLQAAVAELSRDIAQLRLEARQKRKETTNSSSRPVSRNRSTLRRDAR